MYHYCPDCTQKLATSGIAAEIYLMIVEYYVSQDDLIALYEPYFSEALRYLEVQGYITTTEAYEDVILAKPKTYALDDGDTIICCAGTCKATVIDFNGDAA